MLQKNCLDDDTLHKVKLALLYGLGTAAVGAGAAYLYDKERFKKMLHAHAHRLQKSLESKKISEKPKGFFQVNPTLTGSGPGVMASAGPLGVTAHPTGVGASINFHRDTLSNAASKIPFVGGHAENMVDRLPPRMFAGVDVGVGSPITGGMVVDRQGRKEAIGHLMSIKRALKDPNLEKKLDKKIYKKVRSMGHSLMPGTIDKAAFMNKKAYMDGYLQKNSFEPISAGILTGLGLWSAYDAAKRVPKIYRAAKAGDSKEAWKQGALTGVSAAGLIPGVGMVTKSLGKGGVALNAMLNANKAVLPGIKGAGPTFTQASNIGHKAMYLDEAAQVAEKANKMKAAAGGKVPQGWWNVMSKGRRAQRALDAAKTMREGAVKAGLPAEGVLGKAGRGLAHANYAPVVAASKWAPGASEKYLEMLNRAQKTKAWKASDWAGQNWAPFIVGQMGGEAAMGG